MAAKKLQKKASAGGRSKYQAAAGFESLHPRGKGGKFAKKG